MLPADIANLAVAAATLALGAWVLALNPRRRVHRAFALLMLVTAAAYGTHAFIPGSHDPAYKTMLGLFVAVLLALPFAIANFGLVFLRSHARPTNPGRRLAWRLGRAALLLAAVALQAWRVTDAPRFDATDALGFALYFVGLATAALGLAVALQYRRAPEEERRSTFLFALAFSVNPAYFSMVQLVNGLTSARSPMEWVWTAAAGVAVIVCVASVAVVALSARANDAGGPRRNARLMAGLTLAAFVSAGVAELASLLPGPLHWGDILFVASGGAWRLAFAGIVAYGILRYCLFSLDPRFKTVLREGGFATATAILFFTVEQTLQQAVQDSVRLDTLPSLAIGLGAAAGIALLLWPLHRYCGRLADRMARPDDAAGYRRRCLEIYRAAYLAATQDGIVTARERDALRRLADSLGLPEREVSAVERSRLPASTGNSVGA